MEPTTIEIAKKMAAYFNDHITLKALITWNLKASHLLVKHYPDDDDRARNATGFLASFGYVFIPSLLEARSEEERLLRLEEALPDLLRAYLYCNIKPAFAEIGKAFLNDYEEVEQEEEDVTEFMNTLTHLMALGEIYREHEFSDLQKSKAA